MADLCHEDAAITTSNAALAARTPLEQIHSGHDKISVIAGNNQRGATHSPLPGPFVVSVNDAGGNFVHGAPVRFEIIEGIEENARFQDGSSIFETTTDTDGRASAHLTLGREAGFDRYRVVAKLIGTEASAGFTGSALVAGDPGNTSITGTVLDNQDAPIEGVTLRIQNTTRQAVSGPDGKFKIENAPVGPVHLVADGSTSNRDGEWPTLGFELTPVAGAENPLPRPVYLLPLNTSDEGSSGIVGNEDVTLTLPEVPGFALEVKAGSVTFPDGARSGRMSVTAVNTNKIPNPPPNGMQPQFIVTIQPVGAIFDPPARLTLPNVDGYSPGQEVEMFSYSHTLEEFLTVGWGTVSEDGATIRSNEYVGVVESGWHCGAAPGGGGCGHQCDYCEECTGNCNCELVPKRLKQEQQPDDCKDLYCDGTHSAKDETSALQDDNVAGDCKMPKCVGDKPEVVWTSSETPEENFFGQDATCLKCVEGSKPISDEGRQFKDCDDKGCSVCVDGTCQKVSVSITSDVPSYLCVGQSLSLSASTSPPGAYHKIEWIEMIGGAMSVSGSGASATASAKSYGSANIVAYVGENVFSCGGSGRNTKVFPVTAESVTPDPEENLRILKTECPDVTQQNKPYFINGCTIVPNDPVSIIASLLTGEAPYLNEAPLAFGEYQGWVGAPNGMACNIHDACYESCGKQKQSCDQRMLTDAVDTCTTAYPNAGGQCPYGDNLTLCARYFQEASACYAAASIYYEGVVSLGSDAYVDGQLNWCTCCN